MGVDRLEPEPARRERLARIFIREREKDLLVSKYRDQCNSKGFRRRKEASVASDHEAQAPVSGSLFVSGTALETASNYDEQENPRPDDAVSCCSVSAYTTSTPERRASLMARLATPSCKPGSGALSARTPRSRGEAEVSIGDAAYASSAAACDVLDAIDEDLEPSASPPLEEERPSNSLEWAVLDKIAAELHKQDNMKAKQREWELKQRLRQDLDRQMADERLKQEREKAEEQQFIQMQDEHSKIWTQQMEQRAAERKLKIDATQKDREGQLALLRAKREEEKAQEKQERQDLMDSLHRDIQRDKLNAEERMKTRREQVQKAFKETCEASQLRKVQADLLALEEQQKVEAYEQLRAERERCRRETAEKEAAHRRDIEEHANARAVAIRRLDDTESRALAERQAKDRAAELSEQANRKKLEEMKNQTQEYLLQQMKEKQLKKALEAEKARKLAQAQAAEVKQLEAQEKERADFKKKMIRDHHSELERQIKARGRQRNHQEAMSDCELRLNRQLLEKVSLALTDISAKTC